jgi:hypothetical protein
MSGLMETSIRELTPKVINDGGDLEVSGIRNIEVKKALLHQDVERIEVGDGAVVHKDQMWLVLKRAAAGMEEGISYTFQKPWYLRWFGEQNHHFQVIKTNSVLKVTLPE